MGLRMARWCIRSSRLTITSALAHHFLNKSMGDEDSRVQLDAFELIAKEGRKYWITLCPATQQPRDIRFFSFCPASQQSLQNALRDNMQYLFWPEACFIRSPHGMARIAAPIATPKNEQQRRRKPQHQRWKKNRKIRKSSNHIIR